MSTNLPAPIRARHDGWTPARQQHFLAMLADTGSVAMAARAVGLSRAAAYALRRHPQAEDFRAAWDLAVQDAARQIEECLLDRLINGETITVTGPDGHRLIRHQPCNARLAIALLHRLDARRAALHTPATPQKSPARTQSPPQITPQPPAHPEHAFHNLCRTLPDRPGWVPLAAPDLASPLPPPGPALQTINLVPDSPRHPLGSRSTRLRPPRANSRSSPSTLSTSSPAPRGFTWPRTPRSP